MQHICLGPFLLCWATLKASVSESMIRNRFVSAHYIDILLLLLFERQVTVGSFLASQVMPGTLCWPWSSAGFRPQKHVPVMSNPSRVWHCSDRGSKAERAGWDLLHLCSHPENSERSQCSHRGIWHDAVMSLAGSSWLPFLSIETCFRSAPVATKNYIARGNARDWIPPLSLSLSLWKQVKETIIYIKNYTVWINRALKCEFIIAKTKMCFSCLEMLRQLLEKFHFPLVSQRLRAERTSGIGRIGFTCYFWLSPWRSRRMLFAAVAKASLRLPVPG